MPNLPSIVKTIIEKKLFGLPKFQIAKMITKDQFKQIAIGAKPETIDKFYDPLIVTLDKYQINTKLKIAHFLAQILHESVNLGVLAEAGWLSEAKRRAYYLKTYKGRTSIIPDESKPIANWYIGRGAIQTTHDFNYRSYGKYIGKEEALMADPSLLEKDPYYAMDSAGYFWFKTDLNVYAVQDNLLKVTKIINGGTNGLEDRAEKLERAKKVLGLL